MARKKKHPEHVNHERWLVSYADFITLLFAFFTTMYAISTVDAQKMGKMVMSMKASFDGSVFPDGSNSLTLQQGQGSSAYMGRDLVDRVLPSKSLAEEKSGAIKELKKNYQPEEFEALTKVRNEVESALQAEMVSGKLSTRLESRGLVVSLGEGGFFDSGSDELKPEGKRILDSLATILATAGSHVRVEGHTDNMPIHTARFPSNWELSTARATMIVSYLVARFNFTPVKLSAAGYGEFRPLVANDSPEGRERNRRVDFVVLSSQFAEGEPR